MRLVVSILSALAIAGCAAESKNLLENVQETVGRRPPCMTDVAGTCHQVYPTRAALAFARELECTGYVMGKAYMLMDAGYSADRMQIGLTRDGRHAVLVVDHIFVLDNLRPGIGSPVEYAGLSYIPMRRW